MENFADIFMSTAIGIISFAIGVSLHFKDFGRIFRKPKGILTGLVAQIILLPALAFLIITFWPIDGVYKAGFILIASCPGGTMSNLLTFVLRGRVALSVSLTAFNSIIILFTIPLLVHLGMDLFMGQGNGVNLSFSRTFGNIFWVVIIPTISGVLFNELTPDKITDRIKPSLRYLVTALLIGAALVVLLSGEDNKADNILENLHLIIPLVILNISSMIGGFLLSGMKIINLDHKSCYTIAIEAGLQNSALAIYVANEVVENQQMAMMAILYGGFSLFTSAGLALILKRFFTPQSERD